jgi:hypothetical protein
MTPSNVFAHIGALLSKKYSDFSCGISSKNNLLSHRDMFTKTTVDIIGTNPEKFATCCRYS